MHLTAMTKQGLMIGAIALLAVVGLIGWTRGGSSAPAVPVNTAAGSVAYSSDPEPVAPAPAGAPVGAPAIPAGSRTVYAASPFGSDVVPSPAVPPTPPSSYSAYAYSSRSADRFVGSAPVIETAALRRRRVARRTAYYRPRRRYVVVRRRPFKHSAAIVGGSAAGGALIGGLAGGGEGAAVGALVGGGGGLVYDRLTHKKKVVVER